MTKQELRELVAAQMESTESVSVVEATDEEVLAYEEAFMESCFESMNYICTLTESAGAGSPQDILNNIKDEYSKSAADAASKAYQKVLKATGDMDEAAAAAKKAAEKKANSLAAKLGNAFSSNGGKIIASMKNEDGTVNKKNVAIAGAATALIAAAATAGIVAGKKAAKAKKAEEEKK